MPVQFHSFFSIENAVVVSKEKKEMFFSPFEKHNVYLGLENDGSNANGMCFFNGLNWQLLEKKPTFG